MKLLCLSNGHGEDLIAVRILEALRSRSPEIEIAALPLVGEGLTYHQADIPIIGPVKKMPSGGFIYMDGRQLWNDVKGGLLGLTLAQYRLVRRWGKAGGKILAVGDIVPLLFGWLSGADYTFVGTAKSEYYIRDEYGQMLKARKSEGWSGSVYLPWERWLMGRSRCKGIFPRDRLTTNILQNFNLPAYDLGNPMMDGLTLQDSTPQFYDSQEGKREKHRPFNILLLPGSRSPEAYRNWGIIMKAVSAIMETFSGRSLRFFGAIAPSLDMNGLMNPLSHWQAVKPHSVNLPFEDPKGVILQQDQATMILTQNHYQTCLKLADFALAMAGTATEQFVGLGKPVISLPGQGPQFNPQFAEAQTRLLGVSVTLAKQPKDVPQIMQNILKNPDLLQIIGENGVKRMGQPGAAVRIADCILDLLFVD